ncbi:MAG: sugar phosphate isomerase/epimerase family protein [Thermodesulfobacteriota bacterium]
MTSALVEKIFVSTTYPRLRDNLAFFIENGWQPEIALEGTVLYDEPRQSFQAVAHALKEAKLPCTFHAPFFELQPASLDPRIREVSQAKLDLAFDLAQLFQPRSVVCHLAFEENKQGYKEDLWFEQAVATWSHFARRAEEAHTTLMLENTYEKSPAQLKRILTALNSDHARFCLDVGHVLAFAKNRWQDWLPELSPFLGQLHLHDNHGDRDSHLAVGQGIFDFASLFNYLREIQARPILTLEAHQEDDVVKGFAALEGLGLLDALPANPLGISQLSRRH